MQEHQQRVIDEKAELDEKLTRLNGFFGTKVFSGLPESEKHRMRRQVVVMSKYSNILGERIQAF